jgi:hypothetical protein
VVTSKTHPIYRKKYQVSRKFMAHDEKNEATTGDKVSIVETRPISARKRYKLTKIIERPVLRDGIAGDIEVPKIEKKPIVKKAPKSEEKTAKTEKPAKEAEKTGDKE